MWVKADVACWVAAIAFISGAVADCPDPDDNGVYQIHSQSDAEEFDSSCPVINGNVLIDGATSNSDIILNNVQNIIGNISVTVASGLPLNSGYGRVAIPALASITGELRVLAQVSNYTLSQVDLPALKSVGGASSWSGLSTMGAVNLTSLETVGGPLFFANMPNLARISVPKLTSAGSIYLDTLARLQYLSFPAGLQNLTGTNNSANFFVNSTGLTNLDGLVFPRSTSIMVINNYFLSNITLNVTTIAKQDSPSLLDDASLTIESNGDNFNLTLSNLKTVAGLVSLSNVQTVNMPSLSSVGNILQVGASQRARSRPGGSPLGDLAAFNAPSLTGVNQTIVFKDLSLLTNITMPLLQNATSIAFVNTAAQDLANGISLPSLKIVRDFTLFGTKSPYCPKWDNVRCLGIITGLYSCGDFDNPSRVRITADANYCNSEYPTDGSWPRSKKLAVGLGVGLGVGLSLVLLAMMIFCCIRWRKRVAVQKARTEKLGLATPYFTSEGEEVQMPPLGKRVTAY